MRPDFYGLLKILLPFATLKLTGPITRQQSLLGTFIDRPHLKSLLALLRFSTLFHGTRAIDASGYEISQHTTTQQHQFMVAYVFALPPGHFKLCVTTITTTYQQVTPASRFFPGLTWGERELSELLGINFEHKVDARRLMLDYAFEGHPLRKNFPTVGFEEIAYNARDRGLVYTATKLRDDINF